MSATAWQAGAQQAAPLPLTVIVLGDADALQGAAIVLLDAAVVAAVAEIDEEADYQPDNQASPVDPAEFVHHVAVESDAQDRDEGNPRSAEGARLIWIGFAQNHD